MRENVRACSLARSRRRRWYFSSVIARADVSVEKKRERIRHANAVISAGRPARQLSRLMISRRERSRARIWRVIKFSASFYPKTARVNVTYERALHINARAAAIRITNLIVARSQSALRAPRRERKSAVLPGALRLLRTANCYV